MTPGASFQARPSAAVNSGSKVTAVDCTEEASSRTRPVDSKRAMVRSASASPARCSSPASPAVPGDPPASRAMSAPASRSPAPRATTAAPRDRDREPVNSVSRRPSSATCSASGARRARLRRARQCDPAASASSTSRSAADRSRGSRPPRPPPSPAWRAGPRPGRLCVFRGTWRSTSKAIREILSNRGLRRPRGAVHRPSPESPNVTPAVDGAAAAASSACARSALRSPRSSRPIDRRTVPGRTSVQATCSGVRSREPISCGGNTSDSVEPGLAVIATGAAPRRSAARLPRRRAGRS